jgi:sulfur-carrier protein
LVRTVGTNRNGLSGGSNSFRLLSVCLRLVARYYGNMIRVELPNHLRTLAHVGREVTLEIEGPVTQRSVLDALEARYPMLRGTIRDHGTLERRAFLRFFACEEDLSHQSPDALLPESVASGKEPFVVLGAIAGG